MSTLSNVGPNPVVLASSPDDAAAAEAVEQHHAALAGALSAHVQALLNAAAAAPADVEQARRALVAWCDRELIPHALAEEKQLYPAGHELPEAKLLVDAMLAEHQVIVSLVDQVRHADAGVPAAAAAVALQTLFDVHLAKENDQLLPLLTSASHISLAGLLAGMHELLGGHEHAQDHEHEHGHGGHQCSCGETDDPDAWPELDVRSVPHAIRHATVFGALEAVRPGGGMVLVAPHDPLPLLAQIEARNPEVFTVSYLQKGPDAWRLLFMRG